MKRISAIALLLVLLVVGCQPTPEQKPMPAPTPTPPLVPSPSLSTTPSPSPTPTPTLKPTPTPTLVPTEKEVEVHFIDAGQGDSILIDSGETEILIDGGDKSPGVVSYLNSYVEGALEVLVATHPHADHIGGLIDILVNFEVNEIWHNGDTSTSKTYADFMSAVNAEKAKIIVLTRGNVIKVDNLTFNVLNPADLNGSTNNNSIFEG